MDKTYSKETLEKLLDIIPEYIFYRDIEGKNIYCNERYAKDLIGLSKENIYGKSYEELDVLKKAAENSRLKDKELIESKEPISYEGVLENKGREKEFIEIRKFPSFDEDGNVNGILGVIKDISYKKEIDRLRDGFFANIKHEFRTPLNMILSSLQLLEKKCADCSVSVCKNPCIKTHQRIYINSLRLLKLSNNFIDLTSAQSGGMELNTRNHDIVNFIELICDNINDYKKFNNISLIFDTDIEEKIISFDSEKIERVILNLISNAIKFNVYGGEVLVKISCDEDYTNISIKDSGIGIKDDSIKIIFDSFSNMTQRYTKVSEGSGVGLALTKCLVEMHRGYISVKSEEQKGSEFIVSIPNIVNKDEEIDFSYDKIDTNGLERIKMELSDIY